MKTDEELFNLYIAMNITGELANFMRAYRLAEEAQAVLLNELAIRLNSLEALACYQDEVGMDWWMTEFTHEQMTGSITRCAEIATQLTRTSED